MTDTEIHGGLVYHYAAPAGLSASMMGEIGALIEGGGSVPPARVRENLARAFLIGYVMDDDALIGCAVLKEPRPEFTRMVREQTGIDLSGLLERGYSSVLPAYRGKGIASKLLKDLTARVGERKLYSVIGEDNTGGQKIALNNRTRKIAVYESPNTGKKIGIWMPEWMIEPGFQSTS